MPDVLHYFNTRHLVPEFDSVKLVSRLQQLGSESSGDELSVPR